MAENIVTKQCVKCNILKSISEFFRDKSRWDGFSPYCKDCRRIEQKEYREKNKDRLSNYSIAYQKSEKGKRVHAKSVAAWQEKNRRKRDVHVFINNAIARGLLPRVKSKSCVVCGNQAQEYHHEDYNKPLEVQAVCSSCHNKIHLALKSG
jgi:hypothetical protein